MVEFISCTNPPTILQGCFFMYVIWPFVLTFALVFGVLHKSKIFGDNKNQINAIISAVIAIIFVSFANYVDIVSYLLALMVLGLIVLLVFMMLFGFIHKEGEFSLKPGLISTLGYIIGVGVLIAVLVLTGGWGYIVSFVKSGDNSGWVGSIIMVLIIGAAIWAVVSGSGDKNKSEKK